jgi:hypothetical protein
MEEFSIAARLIKDSMAGALRRPNMLRYSNSIARGIKELEASLVPSDNLLAAWAKLQHIAEEAAVSLQLDQQGSQIDSRDISISLNVTGFRNQLEMWKERYWHSANCKSIHI